MGWADMSGPSPRTRLCDSCRHVFPCTQGSDHVLTREQYLYATIIIYNFGMNVIKISFLLQYRRIFQAEWTQRVCLWMMIYVMIWAVIQDVLLGVSCLPVSFIIPSTAGWCLSTLRVWYTSSAMSIVTDFLIFLIPLPSVLKLQLPKRQKTMISGVFCLGFLYVHLPRVGNTPMPLRKNPADRALASASASFPLSESSACARLSIALTQPGSTLAPPSGPLLNSTAASSARAFRRSGHYSHASYRDLDRASRAVRATSITVLPLQAWTRRSAGTRPMSRAAAPKSWLSAPCRVGTPPLASTPCVRPIISRKTIASTWAWGRLVARTRIASW